MEKENFNMIELHLSKFGGGEVSICKEYYDKGIAIIYLNNTQKKNSITGSMMVEMRRCIVELEEWKEGKAVIISGHGDNFCSGGDLEFAKQTGNEQGALSMSTWMMDSLTRLSRLPLISICLAHGPTLGGGVEISTFCDFIVVAEDVKYGFVHGKLGIITAWGGGTRLKEKIGIRRALKLVLSSKLLTAKECLDIGIADEIVPSSDKLRHTLDWVQQYLIHHHSVVRSFKELLQAPLKEYYDESLALERKLTSVLWGGEENKKMLALRIKHCKTSENNQ